MVRRFFTGESRAVLLSGVVLNWGGALKLGRDVWSSNGRAGTPADYEQMKAFTAGTAATFGAFYLYLYLEEKPVVPWLMFGASLKMWAFALSLVLRAQDRLDFSDFISFGVSNGLVGSLLWAHVLRARKPAHEVAIPAAWTADNRDWTG